MNHNPAEGLLPIAMNGPHNSRPKLNTNSRPAQDYISRTRIDENIVDVEGSMSGIFSNHSLVGARKTTTPENNFVAPTKST